MIIKAVGRMAMTILFAGVSLHAMSQQMPIQSKFGFKAGVNHTRMNFHRGYLPAGHSPLESTPSKSMTFGFFLNLPVAPGFSLQPEYLFTERKSRLTETATELKLQYLSLPVLLHYRINKRVSIPGGPQVDLLIHATRKKDNDSKNITHDTEERNLGVTGGFRYLLLKNTFLEARYLHGINNVGIGQRSDVSEFKYEIFDLSVGIRF